MQLPNYYGLLITMNQKEKKVYCSVPDLHADLIMHQEMFGLGFLVLRVFKYRYNFFAVYMLFIFLQKLM